MAPRGGGVRPVDHTIAEVAATNGGRYSIDAHLQHDPTASERFAETHLRRLEAMRKIGRGVKREPDGMWIITPDHHYKIEKFEASRLRDRTVTVGTLSELPLDTLTALEAATRLERSMARIGSAPARTQAP